MKKYIKETVAFLRKDPLGAVALGLMAASAVFVLGTAFKVISKPTNNDLTLTSVKIVRPDGRSGGSGVILSSSTYQSTVLTNHHVCGVIEKGGIVECNGEKHAVVTYKYSQFHDMCLVTVAANLGVNTKLAKAPPSINESATVVGHPHLQPTTITRGYFSNHEMIEILTSLRPCVDQDIAQDPDNGLLCMLVGGIPVITRYEAQVATALIQPGSSGSPVFNEKGEISGLVFAGTGDLGFAFIVPYENVALFLNSEAPLLAEVQPNNTFEITAKMLSGQRDYIDEGAQGKIKTMCKDPSNSNKPAIQRICNIADKDLIWRR